MCFVAIGLETNFKELISVGGGRPAAAYWISQTANAVWTLVYFAGSCGPVFLHPGYSAGLIFSDDREGVHFLNAFLYFPPLMFYKTPESTG